MAPDDLAIRIEGIGKRYPLRRAPKGQTIREAISDGVTSIFRHGTSGARGNVDLFWALRDINLNVARGESVGLIGANGSGKSTLLKIISRIVKPTEGSAQIRGRVGALLEVGTGFHPDLTGRDNILLNGAIIGMTGAEIRSRFDEIVDFSGVEEFLDTPIKRYSSGMVMRLAFAVAAHLEPDVLIVDEVLAVGDAEFQRKSLSKINDVATSGCTVFFVSHNLGFVQQLCSRTLLLEHGRLVEDGAPSQVVKSYLEKNAVFAPPSQWQELPPPATQGKHDARFTAVRCTNPLNPDTPPQSCGPARFEVRVSSNEAFRGSIAVDIYDEMGNRLINLDAAVRGELVDIPVGDSLWALEVEKVYLNGGNYVVGLWLATPADVAVDHRLTAMRFTLLGEDLSMPDLNQSAQEEGLVPKKFRISRIEAEQNA